MKNIILFTLCFLGLTLQAQITTPAASPKSVTTQTIGMTEVTVEYSRPSVKGRTIFSADGLVPLGKKWRLGANRVTKITFGGDVSVGGQALEGGSYAVLATPTAKEWTFHFYPHDTGSWSKYVDREPTVSVSAAAHMMPAPVETFMIITDGHTDNSANLTFLWDKTYVELPISTVVDEVVMKNIDKVMAGPSANDYYQAATYYHKSGKDLNKALSWIEKATDGEDKKFWQVRRKALILGDLGKVKDAIAAAKMSMELAEKAGNDEYVKMNKAFISKHSK